MESYPAFRSALRTWAFSLWDQMRGEVGNVRLQLVIPQQIGGDSVGTMRNAPADVWPDRFATEAFYYPSWAEVRAAWRADPELWIQHDTQVGPAGFKASLGEHELGYAFWPTRRLRAFWESRSDPDNVREEEFQKIYASVEQFLSNKPREFVFLNPLCGLVINGSIPLEDGLILDCFTRDELQLLVERGIIRGQRAGIVTADNADQTRRYGLRRVVASSKYIGNTFEATEAFEHQQLVAQPERDRERIMRTLGVCLDGSIMPQPYVGFLRNWHPGGSEQSTAKPLPAFVGFSVPAVHLSVTDAPLIQHVWSVLGHPAFENSGSLRIAIDRLALRGMRSNAIDVFVDAAIASEAFFRSGEPRTLPQPKGKQESTAARVNRRASEFIDGSDLNMDTEAVREFFHQAYDLRNGVVHRGEQPESIDVGGKVISLDAFIDRYVALVRRAIMRHLWEHAEPAAPIWDESASVDAS